MRFFRLTLKSMTLKDLKLKVEIWDKAQREAARRRKSDWVKILGDGGSKYPSKITWPKLKCISTRRMRIVELSRSTSASIFFVVGEPKFIIFWSNTEGTAVNQVCFQLLMS